MKAMVLRAPAPIEDRPLALENRPDPEPGPGEVLLEVRCCGACHTDLHTAEGDLDLPRLPLVPGHQIVGRVAGRGAGADRYAEGDRVGVAWLHDACGACRFCDSGRENLCEGARFTGLHTDGGYAELVTVPEAFAFPLPEGTGDVEAAPLLCAGIIGYRAYRMARPEPGGVLALVGFGASAHVTIQVARHEGMRVFAVSRNREHREHAAALGAEWTGQMDDDPPEPFQSAICFAPAGGLVPRILAKMDRGATLALAGVTMSPIPEIDYDADLYHERAVTSVANFTRRDARDLLRLAGEIPIRTAVEAHPLSAANEVLLRLKQSRIQGAAVLTVRM